MARTVKGNCRFINFASSFGVVAVCSILLAGCSHEHLNPLDQLSADEAPVGQVNADFCTMNANSIKSKLKFIFLVDKSGSNQTISGIPGTDPDGTRRYNAILDFVNQVPVDPTDPTGIEFALINFSTDASNPGNGGFLQKTAFMNLVISQKYQNTSATCGNPFPNNSWQPGAAIPLGAGCPSDSGWTNYQSAVTEAYDMIDGPTGDIAANKAATTDLTQIVSTYYVAFLITDGAPVVGGSGPYTYQDPATQVDPTVTNLEAIETGADKDWVEAIQLNTLFYYNACNSNTDPTCVNNGFPVCDPSTGPGDVANPDATIPITNYCPDNYLKTMANLGQGTFVLTGSAIDFSQFSIPTRKVKHALRDVFVENANSVWWNGHLMLDSDGDGLPDAIELELGSDPTSYDTDGNGVSDGVEYRAYGTPCGDAACRTAGRRAFTFCNDVLNPAYAPGNGQPKFKDSDKDILNDCEEKHVLNSNYTSFDSGADWIPDWLGFKFGLSFTNNNTNNNGGNTQPVPYSQANLIPMGDGVTNYQKIKTNFPVYYNVNNLLDPKPYQYDLQIVSDSPDQTCYHLTVSNVSMMTPDQTDSVRIYVMENPAIIDTKRYFRGAAKRFVNGQVNFSDSDIVLLSSGS